jgi:Zn-dependent protease with chaperone function
MLPLQFILLLLIVSLPREMTDAAQGAPLPALHLVPAPLAYVILVFAQASIAILAVVKTRRTIQLLHHSTESASAIARKADITFIQSRLGASLVTGAVLFCTPLAATLVPWVNHTAVLKYFMVPELLFMLPAVMAWMAIWIAGYHLEEALRQRCLPYQLAQAVPVHDMPSLGSYLAMQARHNFYPLFFLFLQGFINAAADLARRNSHSSAQANTAEIVVTSLSLLLILVLLPWLLTRIWSTTPLFGALRQRLEAVAARHGLRFGDIRLWRTHHMILNAAVVGWVPRGRYFLITDTLVESLSDNQLEVVFAHEVGHGIHKHLPWMMAAILSVVALSTGISGLTVVAMHLGESEGNMVALALSSVLLCALGVAAIGWISPRFEHQADWFACRHMAQRLRETPRLEDPPGAKTEIPAPLADALAPAPTTAEQVTVDQYRAGLYPNNPQGTPVSAEPPAAAPPPPLEIAGAEIFISSLEAIIETSHRDRNRRGLFHPSVAQRASLLRRLALDPAAETRFNRALRRVRWLIVLLAVVSGATLAAAIYLESTQPTPPPPTTTESAAAATAVAP